MRNNKITLWIEFNADPSVIEGIFLLHTCIGKVVYDLIVGTKIYVTFTSLLP